MVLDFSYEKPTFILYFSILSIEIFLFSYGVFNYFIKLKIGLLKSINLNIMDNIYLFEDKNVT